MDVWGDKETVLFRNLMTKSKELPLECVWFILLPASFASSLCIRCVRGSIVCQLDCGSAMLTDFCSCCASSSWCHCGAGHMTLAVLFTLLTALITTLSKKGSEYFCVEWSLAWSSRMESLPYHNHLLLGSFEWKTQIVFFWDAALQESTHFWFWNSFHLYSEVQMYSTNPSGNNTLSCNAASTKLPLECPWIARTHRNCLEEFGIKQYWNLFLALPPCARIDIQSLCDHCEAPSNFFFQHSSMTSLNWIAPSTSDGPIVHVVALGLRPLTLHNTCDRVIVVFQSLWCAFVWVLPLSVYCPELMLSRHEVACARSCVCFEFKFKLDAKFVFNLLSW